MNDRIKLAEAMGWASAGDPDGNVWWSAPPTKYPESYCFDTDELPDPFTDANDDYAVLEWMRNNATWVVGDETDKFFDQLEWGTWEYEIGDYARAALKVIQSEG